jgi:hypothetical protein
MILRIRTLGVGVAIACSDETMRRRLAELYSSCTETAGGTTDLDLEIVCQERRYELRDRDDVLCATADLDEAAEWVAWRVNQAATTRPSEQLLLHAAAAALGDRAAVVVGPSGSGKSTLAAALVIDGLRYMGDDGIAAEDKGVVRSNPKPLSLDAGSRVALAAFAPGNRELARGANVVAPLALGPVAGADTEVAPRVVVRPCYKPGCDFRFEPLSGGDVGEMLAEESFNFAALGASGLRCVAAIARQVRGYSLEYSDLRTVRDFIRSELA